MKGLQKLITFAGYCLTLVGCAVGLPESYTQKDELPAIYPDYTDVTIPVNIAPLSFLIDQEADDAIVRYSHDNDEILCSGLKAQPSISEWKELTAKTAGSDITVEVYTKNDGQWTRFKPFSFHVSKDSIDPYISYRLISPSYVTYEELTLNQRCLENYDEKVMVDNILCCTEKDGQCVNCHNYQQYNAQRMQFHARQNHGGTVIAYDGQIKKVNLKSDSTISAGVYPAWHPTLPLIVYSTNNTSQSFHTRNLNKIEVSDSRSDLIIYDIEKNEVANVEKAPDEFECYPAWTPDGRTLYFVSAHFEYHDSIDEATEQYLRATDFKYNIYRKSFDPSKRCFGPRETVFRADSLYASFMNLPDSIGKDTIGLSATLPRISPDGRFLLFTLGRYGVFHIWHHEADLYLMNLSDGTVRALDEVNSNDTESYHSWSSNGRWIIVSSRRNDGNFTRPFIAHIDADGRGSKAFELPQKDPGYHRELMKSYNIPEFMRGPVTITPQEFADVLLSEDEVPPARFVSLPTSSAYSSLPSDLR